MTKPDGVGDDRTAPTRSVSPPFDPFSFPPPGGPRMPSPRHESWMNDPPPPWMPPPPHRQRVGAGWAPVGPVYAPLPVSPVPARRRSPMRARFWVALLVVLVGGANALVTMANNADTYANNERSIVGDDRPTPTDEPDRLLPPVIGPDSSEFDFVTRQDNSTAPVGYDPCKTIQVVMNSRTAPPGATELVKSALETMTSVTGLQFVFEGETDEVAAGRPDYQPARYGDRWAPVLIEWSDQAAAPELGAHPDFAGDVLGYGGSSGWSVRDSASVLVTGMVVLDGSTLTAMGQEQGPEVVAAVVLHELGHVVGLAHVPYQDQLMYEAHIDGTNTFQDGDLAGLALAGAGACQPLL